MKNAFVASVLLASAAPAIATTLGSSPDGTCGPNTKFTCKQSFYGGCCGSDGKCGSTADVCGTGCQSDYGYCSNTKDKRWNLGMPSFVLPVTSSKSSSSSKASYSPSKSLNGTKGYNYVKPTPAAAYDYASTVTITSVASTSTEPSFPWWWPFGKGLKSAVSAATSPTPASPVKGGSQGKPVVYSKFTTLTITATKTHTFNYKGSKSFSYETYASPTVCPIETIVTLSTVTKTKTHTVTTKGSTSMSYEPYITESLCTLERPVTTTTASSAKSSGSVKASSNPWWNPASVTAKTSTYSSGYSSASHSGHGSSYSSVSQSSYSHSGPASSSPASVPVGPTFSSVPSGSISVPVGPTSSSSSSSVVSESSSSVESSSTPVGPTFSSEISSTSSAPEVSSTSSAPEVSSTSSSPDVSSTSSAPEISSTSSVPDISSTSSAPEASSTSSDLSSSSSAEISLTSSAPEVSSTSSDLSSSSTWSSAFTSETSSVPESSSASSDFPSSTSSAAESSSTSSDFPSSTSSAPESSSTSSDSPSSTSSDVASSSSSDVTSSTSSAADSSSSDISSSTWSGFPSSTSSDVSSSSSDIASTSSDVSSVTSTSSAAASSSTSSDVVSSSSDVSSSSSEVSSTSSDVSSITSTSSAAASSSISSDVVSSSSDVSSSASDSSSSASITSSASASDSSSSTTITSSDSSVSSSDSATITSTASSSDSSSSSISITSSDSSSSISANATITSSSTFSTITSSTTTNSTSSTVSSSSTTVSSCLTAPTLTAATLPNCVPCAGQPGNDQFCGFDINTNSYENTPITCNVVYYEFDITNSTGSPDGVERLVMKVNGQSPGPAIRASWGDTVVVKVNNLLTTNGTSIHFHGIRQLNNNMNDGVPSITQCPIAPGSSMTYTWVAQNYGTSWYHSHYAIQAWEGVLGPMIIDGPHSASFTQDLGVVQLQDWSHFTVDSRYDLAQNATVNPVTGATFGGPVLLDNGLINGQNIWLGDDQNSTAVGSRFVLPALQQDETHLLRIINSAIQSTYKVYLDGHSFTVISVDFVPIVPYTTNILNINIGQRYEVIIDTTGVTPGSYFLRADNQNACAGTVQGLDIRAIANYAGFDGTTPTSTAYNYTTECVDEPIASLVPVVPLTVGGADITEGTLEVVVQGNNASLYKWYLSGTTFFSEYNEPTLLDIWENKTLPTFSGNLLIELPQPKQWVYVIVESPIPLPHPLHLHGHDFFVLAEGAGTTYAAANPTLNLNNPARRDTALLPAAGFIVLAFETDNPGVWLMHCHIGWHTSMGFALQFVEMQDQIASSGALNNSCTLNSTCNAWDAYANANGVVMLDSGV